MYLFFTVLADRLDSDKEVSKEIIKYYMEGRAINTLKQYANAYKGLAKFLNEKQKTLKELDITLMCQYLIMLETNSNKGEGSVKQTLAVVSLLNEAQGLVSVSQDPVVLQVKKSVIKKMNLKKKKRMRLTLTLNEIKILKDNMYTVGSASKDRRLLALVCLMFYGLKRFDDVFDLKLENISFDSEKMKYCIVKSKTEQDCSGKEFSLPRSSKKDGPVEIISWYLDQLDVPQTGYLFPKLKADRSNREGVSPIWNCSMSYNQGRQQFKDKCRELSLSQFDLHSFRIGGASEGARLGVDRNIIKKAGNWKSSAVDLYIRPEHADLAVCKTLMLDN